MNYQDCPKCAGFGWVEGSGILATPDNCPECDGEGRISKEESNNE